MPFSTLMNIVLRNNLPQQLSTAWITFRLVAKDVTPAPYNQPPYAPAGDTTITEFDLHAFAP
jgi:hypothetical protein